MLPSMRVVGRIFHVKQGEVADNCYPLHYLLITFRANE